MPASSRTIRRLATTSSSLNRSKPLSELKKLDPRTVSLNQPVVIFGGFLITQEAYRPLADWIDQATGAAERIRACFQIGLVGHQLGFRLASPA